MAVIIAQCCCLNVLKIEKIIVKIQKKIEFINYNTKNTIAVTSLRLHNCAVLQEAEA